MKPHDAERIGKIRSRTEALIYLEKASAAIPDSAEFESVLALAVSVLDKEIHALTRSVSSIPAEHGRYSARPTMFADTTVEDEEML